VPAVRPERAKHQTESRLQKLRGTVENTNGILRRDMPRKTDITDYSDKDIEMTQMLLNSTPRKCLGYRTPTEAFIQKLNRALEP